MATFEPGPDGDPRVTVVVMTRDRCDELLHALGNLRELSGDVPVVVVDNGSADGTPRAVRAAYPDVTVVALDRNHGAGARTIGARRATTPYVAFSDDDSWWAPGALKRAADLLDTVPRLGLVAARTLVGPQERTDELSLELAASPLPTAGELPGPRVLGFLACAAVVRRDAFLDAGGFHPVVFFLGEETVLALDLAAAGWTLCYVDDVVAHHHPRPGPTRSGRRRLQARNALLSSWLRRPARVALRDTWRLARRGVRDAESRGALLDAVRRLRPALTARRRVPDHVEADVRRLERARPGTLG